MNCDFNAVTVVVNEASFRNLFMQKRTRDRVVPIISASVSWLIFAMMGSGFLPCQSCQQQSSRQTFLARIEQLIDKVCFDADARHKMAMNISENLVPDGLRGHSAFSNRTMTESVTSRRRYALHLPTRHPSPKNRSSQELRRRLLALLRNDGDLHLAFWM